MARCLLNGAAMKPSKFCAVFALVLSACTADVDVLEEDLDPATTLGDEEWSEGPVPLDWASEVDDVAIVIPEDEIGELAAGAPRFQLPFP